MFVFRYLCLFVGIFCLLLDLVDGDSFYSVPYPGNNLKLLITEDKTAELN